MEPFRLDVPEAELEDLRERLRRTRWPEAATADGWAQGIPLDVVRELAAYWADGYDWRRAEARLNAAGQHRTVVDGLGIHLLHVRSPHPGALPLVLTHGWPGSVTEFLDVLGPLTDPPDPADAFHVVCPSLPGFGFSDRPRETGWGVERIAAAWIEVMTRLGYERFGAQGGDWGAEVSTRIAEQAPERVAGVHVNMAIVPPHMIGAVGEPDAEEQALIARALEHQKTGTGYSKQQSTRPQTLGYGLVDSPVALLAWVAEKLHAWSDVPPTADQILDDVMLYWLPGTGASAARLYWESYRGWSREPVTVPAGVSVFPEEIMPVSRRWAEQRFTDLRHFARLERGGHFAALEQPELFTDELRAFFRLVR